MNEKAIHWDEYVRTLPPALDDRELNGEWLSAVSKIKGKIVVLDDDPTGIQTVHSVPVYTSWDPDTVKKIMRDASKMVFILTNSRAMTADETEKVHSLLVQNLIKASEEEGKEFLLISRGDSTLRGHYPLETRTIYNGLRRKKTIHGEILLPFFLEGGRLTLHDVHYVKQKDRLVPAGQTEFAGDSTFGYTSSNLREWVEEKTGGEYPAKEVVSISLEALRKKDIQGIVKQLQKVEGFNKVVVNAAEYSDLKVFTIALVEAMSRGRNFVFRTAASFVRVFGGITPKPLLTREALYGRDNTQNPGLIIIGSYVHKTTRQFEELQILSGISFIEWSVEKAISDDSMAVETDRVVQEIERAFLQGMDACVYTSREFYRNDKQKEVSEKNLLFSTRVSEGLVGVVKNLTSRPGFLIAKGGITSSDIGVRGLGTKRAIVLGQVEPGIPVWETGDESRFPGLPYIIFPGNVGEEDSLKKIVTKLRFISY